MRLWEVSRWGNDEDPDLSHDTNCLVVAPDHETAARLVVEPGGQAEVIYGLGVCCAQASDAEARVVRGPYLANKYNTHYFTAAAASVRRASVPPAGIAVASRVIANTVWLLSSTRTARADRPQSTALEGRVDLHFQCPGGR